MTGDELGFELGDAFSRQSGRPTHLRLAAIRLLILTGARLREILDARWENVDIERGVIFLTNSKTGRKPVFFSAAAQTVMAALPEGSKAIRISFPGSNQARRERT